MSSFILQHKFLLAIVAVLLLLTLFVLLRKPSHEGNWRVPQQKLPQVSLREQGFHIKNIRDFRYDENGSIVSENYQDASFQFDDLNQLWFGLSHFGENGLAHAFLSFQFGQEYLTLSIEARLEQDQSYNPFWGILRRYEKIYVFATENDVIGLRSHSRQEKVLLYPVNFNKQASIDLLNRYLLEAQTLETVPDFYNTLLDNCLTGILRASGHFSSWDFLTNTRLMFPGRSDSLAQEFGLIDQELTLDALREKATIDPEVSDPLVDSFSEKIRVNW